jgi:origin recognition complex subunit 3
MEVFCAQPRESHKTAFRNPAYWLQCQCCQSQEQGIGGTQPSTSILHECFLESATGLINLYDLFGMYRQVRGDDTEEEVEFARFMASLEELIWMGYVKRTMRKTDHVERLIGG